MDNTTLQFPGLPSLVLSRFSGDDFVSRASIDKIGIGDASVTGTDVLSGSGEQFFTWSFQVIVSLDELILFNEMKSRQQNSYAMRSDGKIILADERYYVSQTESTRNSRVPIGSKATSWGGTAYYISCPVFVRVPEKYWEQIAGDLYSLQFDAKELVR
jgi:hypothetical protein